MSSIIETTRDNLSLLEGKDLWDSMDILHKHSLNNQVLFENLLHWAKLQRGQVIVNKEKIDLHEFCLKIIKQQQSALSAKELSLKISGEKGIKILADPLLLNSICNNLVGNAIKFSHRKGIITIDYIEEATSVKIGITDKGLGIKKERLKDIFSIEKSYSSKGTEGEKGSGFGLILCKELIERIGGNISIVSEEGKGSTIFISLTRSI
jgi:signal transduction histidine kinase